MIWKMICKAVAIVAIAAGALGLVSSRNLEAEAVSLQEVANADLAPMTSTVSARAVRASSELRVDGRLSEPDWSTAPGLTGFRKHNVDPGAPATFETEVRVLYDDRSLFVGMRMQDPAPEAMAAQLGRRDAVSIHSDWAHVFVDAYRDRRSGTVFSLSPRGVQRDGRLYDDTQTDLSWDGIWEGAATVDEEGWTAEFRIPLSQLRFVIAEDGSTAWNVNFGRDVASLNEQSYWSHVPPDAARFVSLFRPLTGLTDLQQPRRLELLPYAVARGLRLPGSPGDPFRGELETGFEGGVDLRYGLTQSLTLTATLNPDFGQVEVDPAVINLTAFETFYPERRPFFVQDAQIFSPTIGGLFNPSETLFYSRRIGRTPQGSVPQDAEFADAPGASRILTAAKVSGKTPSGWSVGLLHAMTAREKADYVVDGSIRSIAVEPLANYGVVRLAKDYREGASALGLIVTGARRAIADDHLSWLPETSVAGGFDWRHRFGSDEYQVEATLLGSYAGGDTTAMDRLQRAPARYLQRPDADHLSYEQDRTSLTGVSANFSASKIAGEIRTGVSGLVRSPGFDSNDLGFMQSADQIRLASWLGFVESEGNRYLRNWSLFTNQRAGWTSGGERLPAMVDVNSLFQAANHWQGFVGIRHTLAGVSPNALRGGPALMASPRTGGWFQIGTDQRRRLSSLAVVQAFGEQDTDGYTLSVAAGPTYRPSEVVSLSVSPTWTRRLDPQQYVATRSVDDQPHYILGEADQQTLSLVTRVNVTLSPTVSLEMFAQPFVSSVDFERFKRVADPHATDPRNRWTQFFGEELRPEETDGARTTHAYYPNGASTPAYTFADPSFRLASLRGNAVFRWEYRPGSTLFFVWQQDRRNLSFVEPFGGADALTDFGDGPANHVFIIKASYWLGL